MLIPSPEHPPERRRFVRPLLSLTWPIAVSMLSYSLMTFVDTIFVGRKGAAAIAAVGLGGLASFTLLTFAMGLLRAGKVLIAHAHGAEGIKRAVRAGVRSIEHGSIMDDEGVELMAERGTYLVADVYGGDYIAETGRAEGWSPEALTS